MDIAALIDRYDAAWNAQDLDTIASMHDDAIVFHNHTAGERVAGAAAVRAHIAAIFARWPTLRFERRALRLGDDFAVSEWTARATHPDDGRGSSGTASTSSRSRPTGASPARTCTRRPGRRACSPADAPL